MPGARRASAKVRSSREQCLASVPASSPPLENLHSQQRRLFRRESARHRRALHEPARPRGCHVLGREVTNPGARTAAAPFATRVLTTGTRNRDLQPSRDNESVRCTRCRDRKGHRRMLSKEASCRVSPLLGECRRERSERAGCTRGRRQLVNPHGAGDPQVAAAASAVPHAFHSHVLIMAEPRRALVREAHQRRSPPRKQPQHTGASGGNPCLHWSIKRGSAALRLDQERRRDPRERREVLPAYACAD